MNGTSNRGEDQVSVYFWPYSVICYTTSGDIEAHLNQLLNKLNTWYRCTALKKRKGNCLFVEKEGGS